MNIDDTNLLEALKKQHPSEPTDAEKVEAANELHEWLHDGGSEKESHENRNI